jgi:hypothetical protein
MTYTHRVADATFTEASFSGQAYADPAIGLPKALEKVVQAAAGAHRLPLTGSIAVGTGAKSGTTYFNAGLYPGETVRLQRAADPAVWMRGTVTSYDPATGAAAFDIAAVNGSGTHADFVAVPVAAVALDIASLTAEATLADDDSFPFYDVSAANDRRVTLADLKDWVFGGAPDLVVDAPTGGSVALSVNGTAVLTAAAAAVSMGAAPLRLGDGAAAAPSLAFVNDNDTGLYLAGSNRIGFAAGGARRVVIDATGLGIGTAVPNAAFVVSNGAAGGVEIAPDGVATTGQLVTVYDRTALAFRDLYLDLNQLRVRPGGTEAFVVSAGFAEVKGASTNGLLLAGQIQLKRASTGLFQSNVDGAAIFPSSDVLYIDNYDGPITLRTGASVARVHIHEHGLSVNSDSSSAGQALWVNGAGKTHYAVFTDSSTATLRLGPDGSGNVIFVSDGSQGFRFSPGNSTRIFINGADGRVAINSGISPSSGYALTVNSGGGFTNGMYVTGASTGVFVSMSGASTQGVFADVTGTSATAIYGRAQGTECIAIVGTKPSVSAGYISYGSYGLYTDYSFYAPGVANTSDGRFKENVVEIAGALDVLALLRPVRFEWTEGFHMKRHMAGVDYGMIAQEVVGVFPELVRETPMPPVVGQDGRVSVQDTGTFLTVDYVRLVPWLIAGINVLAARVEALEAAA